MRSPLSGAANCERKGGEMAEGARPPTTTAFAAKFALAVLKKKGISAAPMLLRAGLSEQVLDNPLARVSAPAQAMFLELSAEALHDTAFGLHLAEQVDPREAGLVFYAASAAGTLSE